MIIAAVLSPTAAMAIPRPGQGESGSDSLLTVSLITCFPGPEIYELCGHEAIRIRGGGIDSVWNYGVFDFAEPNFVGRFVKGETDYMLAGYPFSWFMPEYVRRGSKVVEQDLNLTPEEASRLHRMLQIEALPGNNRYRYNYIRNNCATRIVDRLREAADTTIRLNDSVRYQSFRDEMRHFHRNYPWYQFGIDIALGSGLDAGMQRGEQMFAPVEMMKDVRVMKFQDGRPLLKEERVLNAGKGDVTLAPTEWWATPLAVSIYMLVFTVIICGLDLKYKRITKWWWSVYYGLAGLAGCVVTFLVFFSTHDSTSPNILLFWLNPLQLIIAICIWIRKARNLVTALSLLNIFIMIMMIFAWPMQPQSANAAFFPLMTSNLLLALTWAIMAMKFSYNKGEQEGAPKVVRNKTNPKTRRKSGKRK